MTKTNPAFAPFVELGQDIFGDEVNLRGAADELVLLGSALGAIGMSTAEPSGGATTTQRPPDPNLASKARLNPS